MGRVACAVFDAFHLDLHCVALLCCCAFCVAVGVVARCVVAAVCIGLIAICCCDMMPMRLLVFYCAYCVGVPCCAPHRFVLPHVGCARFCCAGFSMCWCMACFRCFDMAIAVNAILIASLLLAFCMLLLMIRLCCPFPDECVVQWRAVSRRLSCYYMCVVGVNRSAMIAFVSYGLHDGTSHSIT